jgi:hypothetical protein
MHHLNEKVTPGIVKQSLFGKMGKTLDCSTCHAGKVKE